jgi:ABC-type microcin C transport system duplicated ATPase subunit YejF
VTIAAQILELIKDIQREFGMGVLLITHDLEVVRKYASRIYIMKTGRVVEHGTQEAIFTNPAHEYTKRLMSAIPRGRKVPASPGPLLLKTDELTCQFKSFTGWVHPFKRIQNWPNHRLRPLRREIQIVFQDPFSSLSPRFTVQEIIEEGLKIHLPGTSREERYELVVDTLKEVGLTEDMAFRYPHEFSGGQRQRIAIARVIILKPKLLILDEPTSALDVTIQGQIIDLLLNLQQKYGMTYMFITHDLRVIRALADFVAVMQHGKIVEAGPAQKIFTSPAQEYTKTLFAAALGKPRDQSTFT